MGAERARALLEILAKQKMFVEAINTEIGQQLLGYHINRMQDLIEFILKEDDSPEIRAELRAHRKIVDDYTRMISDYTRNLNKALEKGT